ncbi:MULTISPECIES: hypothetical protein [Nocardioides]|uniref:Poly(3-hydroxybutyrate) depolymerase n=1 Tax=Nocardioides vastitatis TaxID=2568655 RepID=A0ABW0ZED5_9ACTN|nr:hypothetical protein [Nocardioides sp.]THJ04319.1 hypothetical protein E7Z54_08885 [Nocardioides sp.]
MPSPLGRRAVLRGAAITSVGAAAAGALAPSSSAAHVADVRDRGTGRPLESPRPLDGRPAPDYDYSRPNRLPQEMTGYWSKTFDVGGTSRSAKVYIPAETPNRAYWIVLGAPEDMTASAFLTRSGWREHADRAGEGLVVLEPGAAGWGGPDAEAAYLDAVLAFHQSNPYYSIFGEHYLVGYEGAAPALERWAAVNPLRVIAQVYLASTGLSERFLREVGSFEYDGTTDGSYTPVELPEDLDRIRRDEVVLPTWYIAPQREAGASIDYWRVANDASQGGRRDGVLGSVYRQRPGSDRWTTSSSGPISLVAVQPRPMKAASRGTTGRIVDFLGAYTRYENFFAYGNQLMERPDLNKMGVEVRTMMVGGHPREYLVYVPSSAKRQWGKMAPVVFVWPGNTQTDRLFFDSAQWWRVADEHGCVVVVICETYAASAISVSHRDSDEFYRKLRDVVLRRYDVDPTRFYSTGQSAGSGVTQTLAIAKPEYFAAVASTSFAGGPDGQGRVTLDGTPYQASGEPIPNYLIYGAGDLSFLAGTLWDDTQNRLDAWADYHLGVNGRSLDEIAEADAVRSGWKNRFRTWTWTTPDTEAPAVKVSLNEYRSHNNTPEETPMLWDFLEHYRHEVAEDGTVTRWWSPSGFRNPADEVQITS